MDLHVGMQYIAWINLWVFSFSFDDQLSYNLEDEFSDPVSVWNGSLADHQMLTNWNFYPIILKYIYASNRHEYSLRFKI
jgi:hypothetical protein